MSTKLTSEQRKRAVSTVRDLMENAIGHGENFALIAVGNLEGVLDHCTALEEELKLAIAHDRQPYPTAEAYEKVCEALNHTKEELKAAQEEI